MNSQTAVAVAALFGCCCSLHVNDRFYQLLYFSNVHNESVLVEHINEFIRLILNWFRAQCNATTTPLQHTEI